MQFVTEKGTSKNAFRVGLNECCPFKANTAKSRDFSDNQTDLTRKSSLE